MAIGDILREFPVPTQAVGNGRAIAYDGTYLYTTHTGSTNIFKMTVTGTYVATIPSAHIYGALYYDALENVFWAGGYENGYNLYKVSMAGTVLQTIHYQTVVPAALLALDPYPGYVDGITVDPVTNTIWFSTDLGVNVFNLTKAGAYIGHIPAPLPNSGVTTDGIDLYLAFADYSPTTLKRVSTVGTVLETVTVNGAGFYQIEDIEYDRVTFSPRCVIWAINATGGTPIVRAIEVPCSDMRGQAITDLIESVALEQAALSHILNAEGEKLQKLVTLSQGDSTLLLRANASATRMVNTVTRLEMILQGKLELFDGCLCPPESDDHVSSNNINLQLFDMSRDPAYIFSKP